MPTPPPTQPPQSRRRGGTRQQAKWRRPGRPRPRRPTDRRRTKERANERGLGHECTTEEREREREKESLLYRLSSLSPGILAHSPPLLSSPLPLTHSVSPGKGRESPAASGQMRRQAPLSGAPEVAAWAAVTVARAARRRRSRNEGAGFVPCSLRVPPPPSSSSSPSLRPAWQSGGGGDSGDGGTRRLQGTNSAPSFRCQRRRRRPWRRGWRAEVCRRRR